LIFFKTVLAAKRDLLDQRRLEGIVVCWDGATENLRLRLFDLVGFAAGTSSP